MHGSVAVYLEVYDDELAVREAMRQRQRHVAGAAAEVDHHRPNVRVRRGAFQQSRQQRGQVVNLRALVVAPRLMTAAPVLVAPSLNDLRR